MLFERCASNPIVVPGIWSWRGSNVYNPGALYENGMTYLFERAAPSLRPHYCAIGLLASPDGIHFEHVVKEPVFSPAMLGYPHGSIQDPRVVAIDGTYYMTFAFRRYAWNISPTGLGVPDASEPDYPGFDRSKDKNQTRSGIARSTDMIHWEFVAWVSGEHIDDRNVILFPERIGGMYALLRRPIGNVSVDTSHSEEHPAVCISYSKDLLDWTEPEVVISPRYDWEDNRIGGSTPPIRTPRGWLVFYHGVQTQKAATRSVVYRMGAVMLDLEDPTRVLSRAPRCLLEPTQYYERYGLSIPNVVFPTGAVVRDGRVWLYYGCCDTSIGLATAPLEAIVNHVFETHQEGAD